MGMDLYITALAMKYEIKPAAIKKITLAGWKEVVQRTFRETRNVKNDPVSMTVIVDERTSSLSSPTLSNMPFNPQNIDAAKAYSRPTAQRIEGYAI